MSDSINDEMRAIQRAMAGKISHCNMAAPIFQAPTEEDEEEWQRIQDMAEERAKKGKYLREIKPGVTVDVYDVLQAWGVTNPALQHLIKKALQPGQRGHKTEQQDMADIVASALRAQELANV